MRSDLENKKQLRLRISTVLIFIALALAPFSHFNAQPIWFPATPEIVHGFFGWLYFELSVMLFFVTFPIALLTAAVLVYRHQWQGVLQCLLEMGVCFAGVLLAPTY